MSPASLTSPPFVRRYRRPPVAAAAGFLVAAALFFAARAPALAAPPPNAREQAKTVVEEAEVQYKLGRFQKALEGYARAYELFPAPALLFDIGQCHRQLKEYDRAIFFFEGYLREETNPARRRLAMDLIAKVKAEMERAKAAPATPPPPSEPPPPPLPLPPVASPSPEPVPSAPAPSAPPPALLERSPAAAPADAPPEHTPITHRWWFWTAIGVGVLAAGGAAAYALSGETTTVLPSGSLGTLDRR